MSKRGEFITFVSTLRTTSQFIIDKQRIGILKQAVQKYGLITEDAEGILKTLGFVTDERINYFETLGLSLSDIQNLPETTLESKVKEAHGKLYKASVSAGSRPRTDGRTQDQWRSVLNKARDTLIEPQKRLQHINKLENEDWIDDFPIDMVYIHAGEFQMGSSRNNAPDNEKPEHTIYLDDFYMDMYEVTNAAFKEFIDQNPEWEKDQIRNEYHDGKYLQSWKGNDFPTGKEFHPVTYVSWYAAMAYAQWISKRLPTEAEWEKAVRGGLNSNIYPWGNNRNLSKANYGRYHTETTPVGSYSPNEYGLYDVSGNVWEWCLDEYSPNFYIGSPDRNPISGGSIRNVTENFTEVNARRVLRGGSWKSKAGDIRVTYRGSGNPNGTSDNVGFRCVKPE